MIRLQRDSAQHWILVLSENVLRGSRGAGVAHWSGCSAAPPHVFSLAQTQSHRVAQWWSRRRFLHQCPERAKGCPLDKRRKVAPLAKAIESINACHWSPRSCYPHQPHSLVNLASERRKRTNELRTPRRSKSRLGLMRVSLSLGQGLGGNGSAFRAPFAALLLLLLQHRDESIYPTDLKCRARVSLSGFVGVAILGNKELQPTHPR